MKAVFAPALVAVMALTACTSAIPDNGVTSSTMPAPQPTDSGMQLEPSKTAQAVAAEVIGMPEAEAIATIEGISSEQLTARVVRRDDENYAVTMDYRLNRINLEIDNGIVTKTFIG
jgi:hypothetical protein